MGGSFKFWECGKNGRENNSKLYVEPVVKAYFIIKFIISWSFYIDMKNIFKVSVIMIFLFSCGQSECDVAEKMARIDFKNDNFKLHSMETFPVESTYFYVLRERFNVKWRFISQDSMRFYYCYDSIMCALLDEKLGIDFRENAKSISDSLENLSNWNSLPEFTGGIKELQKFIAKRLTISKDDMDMDSQIGQRIQIEFEINEKGKVVNPVIRKGINKKIDQKIIDIVDQLPDWTPAYQYGKPIRKKFSFGIYIELE
ncbi:energy transducer TonB [Flagellimonas aequoris]|uniref:TonB C-terminal domain-containing protein n=1 Tax=Flagellimonas aequoris TaxID=2306997 RepID=A0A418NCA5_9FLAO|nr:hypothetical protein [Allomuricauda aequoris]RIV74434.1 hypothetical protein D2U88_00785 [Allomuricauda aequoris]TXK08558.1 hypothetical protein FQ019_00765 [Allomuricauda aequoris]